MNDIIEMTSDLEALEKYFEKKYNRNTVYKLSEIAFIENKHENTIRNWRDSGLPNRSNTKSFKLKMWRDGRDWVITGEKIIGFKLKINT